MEDDFLTRVLELYKQGQWKKVLKLNENCNSNHALKLLWVWPSESNLNFIKKIVKIKKCEGIMSIGCGCGLLEWFIKECTGLKVVGYEVNKEWWESTYSNPQFIELEYVDMNDTKLSLNSNYALLFCYFNNGPAFREYVKNYEGKVIFIIGPGEGKGHHTDPEPFNTHFGVNNWKLYDYEEVKDSKDFIAVYIKS